MAVAPRRFVLDTGLLIEWAIDRFEQMTGLRWPEAVRFHRQLLILPVHRESCDRFLRQNGGRLVTSSGVVAELQGHQRRADRRECRGELPRIREQFWAGVHEGFARYPIIEEHIPLTELPLDAVRELGPVDAGLVELARRSWSSGVPATVVSTDGGLIRRCRREGLPAEQAADELERWRPDVSTV